MTERGPCASCGKPHVMGVWWPRHPFVGQVRVAVDPKELDANGNNDGRYPCSECGDRVMFGVPRGDRPTCGDCLEGRTKLKKELRSAIAEVHRLQNVILTGGAMYRLERATMGIPGGLDRAQAVSDDATAAATVALRALGKQELLFSHHMEVNARPDAYRVLGTFFEAYAEHPRQQATRWQTFTEGRVLAGVQVAIMRLDEVLGSTALGEGDPGMQLSRLLEQLQDEIIRAGTKGPPLTCVEAPHNCPDDDKDYPDTCPGCAAEKAR